MPTLMGVDIETYSSAPLPKCGVYRYCDAPDFEILLFSYAFDDDPVKTIDLASGETLPKEVISVLEDPSIIKVAYNAQFERVCLSRYLGHWLDPHQWRCTMVMAAYLTLPGRLADAAVALGTTEKKMEEGKDLIRYFSVPCKPTKTNGGRTRNLPADAPEKWAVYRQYNAQDVETERAIRKALEQLIDGTLCPEHPRMFQEIYHALLFGDGGGMADPYFVLKDLPQYMAAQKKIDGDYTDKDLWLRKAVLNTACSGGFSSDRTIQEYVDKIWHLKPLHEDK